MAQKFAESLMANRVPRCAVHGRDNSCVEVVKSQRDVNVFLIYRCKVADVEFDVTSSRYR